MIDLSVESMRLVLGDPLIAVIADFLGDLVNGIP